jgi:hypothetical protein
MSMSNTQDEYNGIDSRGSFLHCAAVQRRIVLSESHAVEIYKIKLAFELSGPVGESRQQSPSSRIKGKSADIGRVYNVSPKTVRDVWNHVTWKYATCHLWTESDGLVAQSPGKQASSI